MKPSGTGADHSDGVAAGDVDEQARDEAHGEDIGETTDGADEFAPAGRELTGREREMLAFERKWWRHPGAKEQAIRDTFELSATRYYQILNELLDDPAALAHDPVVVSRLRRLRVARTRSSRSA